MAINEFANVVSDLAALAVLPVPLRITPGTMVWVASLQADFVYTPGNFSPVPDEIIPVYGLSGASWIKHADGDAGTDTPAPNAVPKSREDGKLAPGWLPPSFANADIYVSPDGDDDNDGSEFAPKEHIYNGLVALRASGGGTLHCADLCHVGGPVPGQGIWLEIPAFQTPGFSRPGFVSLDVPIKIKGYGKVGSGPFSLGPMAEYVGGGSSQFLPALWVIGGVTAATWFSMEGMSSNWLTQAILGFSPRAGKLGARLEVDFDRETDGTIKQIPVTNATRTGTSTVLTVDIDAVTPLAVAAAQRASGVVTLTIPNPGLPFPNYGPRVKVKLVSGDSDFPGGEKLVTGMHNWASGNTTWTLVYNEAGADVAPKAVTGVSVLSHGCSQGELLWLSSTNVHFPAQQYIVTEVTDDTVTIFDNFGDGDADEDDVGTIARQERRMCPVVMMRFERCSQGIDSSFDPRGATHAWDIGGNLATWPVLIDCWGEGSISGGGLPNYDWRNFAAYYAYAGGGGGQNDAGASVTLERCNGSNGGICVEASPFGVTSYLLSRECLIEQSSTSSQLPGILFRGNNYSACLIEDFLNADGADGAASVEIVSTPITGAHVVRSGTVKGACIGGDNWRSPASWQANIPNPWNQGQVQAWAGGRITGKHPGAARAMGVLSARYKNVVSDAADWLPGTTTVTPGGGETAPDGMPSDLIETTNVSNVRVALDNTHGITVEEGGRFLFAGWINAADGTGLLNTIAGVVSAGFPTCVLDLDYRGAGWQFVQASAVVRDVTFTPSSFICDLTFGANASVSVYGLTLVYVPPDVTNNDAFEYAGTIKHQPRYLLPGSVGTMEGVKLFGHGGLGGPAPTITLGSANGKAVPYFDPETGDLLGYLELKDEA